MTLAVRFCLPSLAGRFPRPAGLGAATRIAWSSSDAPSKSASAGIGCAGQLSSRSRTICGHHGHTAFPVFAAMRRFPSLSRMDRVETGARGLCMPAEEYNKRIQDVNDQFAEARLLIEVCALSPILFAQAWYFFRTGKRRIHRPCTPPMLWHFLPQWRLEFPPLCIIPTPKPKQQTKPHPASQTRCNQDALDSNGTTYFEEDLADAQEAVAECLKLYNETLDALDDKRKGETQRSMGMKMEQLKVSCAAER